MMTAMRVQAGSRRAIGHPSASASRSRAVVVRAAVSVPSEISKVTPLGDRVVVKAVIVEEKTSSGIFLPSTSQAKPNQGEIVSANVEDVKVGDVVAYSKYAGTEVEIKGEGHLILKNDDLVGVLQAGADVSKMTPLQDRVLIKVDEASDSTAGGLVLTDASKEEPTIGTVVAVGPGMKNAEGELIAPGSTVGSRVMYQKFSGSEFEGSDGAKYIVVKDADILAAVA